MQGCDGSVLIDSTAGNTAERDADDNKTLAPAGFDTVTSAKTAVEAACPGQVSCADILTIATRDAILLVSIVVHVDTCVRFLVHTRVHFMLDRTWPINQFLLCHNRAAGPSTRWSWAGWTA